MSSVISPEATLASLQRDGAKVIVIGSVMLTVALTSVVLRFIAKSLNESSFGVDDLLIGVSLLFYLTTESLVLRAVSVGRQASSVDGAGYVEFAKITTIYSLLYWSVVAFATMSILVLYRRIFASRRLFTVTSNVLLCLVFIWWVSGTIGEGVGFRPIEAYWDTAVSGQYYLNYNGFWLTNMVSELVIETVILLMPVREVIGLQLEKRKKVLVVGMFCMGAFVLATGIVRIHYVWAESDMIPGVIWLSVHSSTAVISACLPTYSPLLARIPGLRHLVARKMPYARSLPSRHTDGGLSTRRNRPSAQLTFPGSPKLRQNSVDDILLEHPQYIRTLSESGSKGSGSGWRYYHSGDAPSTPSGSGKELGAEEDEKGDGGSSAPENGLTKKISVPSPVLGVPGWAPATALGLGREGEGGGGGETRRAGLEWDVPHKLNEKREGR